MPLFIFSLFPHRLFQSFQRNFGMSLTLETFSIAGNKFSEISSNELLNWLSSVREHSQLRKLNLSNSGVNLSTVARGLRGLDKVLCHYVISLVVYMLKALVIFYW